MIDSACQEAWGRPVSDIRFRHAEHHAFISSENHRRLYCWYKLDTSLLDLCLMTTLPGNPAPGQLNVFLRPLVRAALTYSQLPR